MMNTTNTTITQSVLGDLDVKYRKSAFSDGTLYFCTLPNQLTFDLFEGKDGSIKLWRFVGAVPISRAGMRCEYHKPDRPDAAIGLEVTGEGDLCFYAQQRIAEDDLRKEARIRRMVNGYIKTVSTMDSDTIAILTDS